MNPFRKIALGLAGFAALMLGAPFSAQTEAEMIGEWTGVLESPQGGVTLVIYVSRGEEGGLEGKVENAFQAPGDLVPMSEISVADGQLSWRVARIGATYQGGWDAAAREWRGTFNQGIELPLAFRRGPPTAQPVVEGLDGTWEGTAELNGVSLRQIMRIGTGERGTIALYDSPDQMANGLPMGNLTRDGRLVRFTLINGLSNFAGELSADESRLTGTFVTPNQPDITLTFTRTSEGIARAERSRPQTPEEPFPYTAEEVTFDNPADAVVELAGTLTLPEGEGPFPAAVLITGSGPQDRDETILGHKPFAVIADHLTRNGIAVLRYDDRGVGGSTGNYAAATSADLATDANAAARYLMTRGDIRRDAIGFIGHSEGGMIGPIAMAENDDVAFLVMLAGPGTALDQLLLSQRRLAGAQMGMSQKNLDRAEPVMASVFRAIADAETYEAGLEAARTLLTPDAMEALGTTREFSPDVILAQIGTPWFRYFLRYDPVPNLSRIEAPVLALSGSLDVQVPAAENLPAIRAALASNPDVTVIEFEDLNHLFQTSQTGAVGEYADIEETFAPVALKAMSDWLAARFLTE